MSEPEYIGLLNVTDYQNASLSNECTYLKDMACSNYNYLFNNKINTFFINTGLENSYSVLYLSGGGIFSTRAITQRRINPVIYITGKSIKKSGNGTIEDPYIVK